MKKHLSLFVIATVLFSLTISAGITAHADSVFTISDDNCSVYVSSLVTPDQRIDVSPNLSNIALTLGGVALSNSCPITIEDNSNVTLILIGNNTMTSTVDLPAIQLGTGSTLVVSNESTGSLVATCQNGSCAGIGGSSTAADYTIQIDGGTVKGVSTSRSGIGTSYNSNNANIIINGGTVEGDSVDGTGIGGSNMSTTTVTINGGNVTGKSTSGAGIGGGNYGTSTVNITGGTVIASSSSGAGVGSGYKGTSTVNLTGGNITASSVTGAGIGTSSEVSDKATVNISGGATVNASSTDGAAIGSGKAGGIAIIDIKGGNVRAISTNGAGIGTGVGTTQEALITISGGSIVTQGANDIGGIGLDAQTNISGGYIYASNIKYTSIPPVISGGSIGGGNVVGATNSFYVPVYKIIVDLTNGDMKSVPVTSLSITSQGNTYSYGIKDMKTDDYGCLYLYLPQNFGDSITTITVNGKVYTASIPADTMAKEKQAPLSFVGLSSTSAYGQTVPLQVQGGSSGKPVTFSVSGPATLTADSSAFTVTGVGNITISATMPGDTYYGDETATFNVSALPAPLTITAKDKTITYGDAPSDNGVTYSGFVGSEDASVLSGALVISNPYKQYDNAGAYSLSPSGLSSNNYDVKFIPGTLTVNPRPVSVTVSANDKTYDGGTAATVKYTSSDILNNDSAAFTQTSAAFDSAAVGDGKTVTVSGITLTGAKAGNYTLSTNSATAKASITKAPLTVTASASDKVYDGDTNATATLSCTGIINNEDVSTSYTSAAFDSPDAGDGKTVTVSGITLSGSKAGNYTLSSNSATAKASITKAPITVTASAAGKVYDGSPNASVTLSCTGIINNEDVSTSYTSAAFDSAAVGDGKTVTVSGITLTGAKAGNYTLSTNSATTKASITKALVTVTASASDKVYDGNTNATATLSCTGIINNEDVSTSYTSAAFDSPDAGDGKTVTVSGITLTGAKAGNYTLSSNSATAKASITKAPVTITATAVSKVYDGNPNTTATLSCTGIINNEDVSTSYTSAAFDSAAVGDGKTVTVSGISLTGSKAGNYTLSSNSATAKASITKAQSASTLTVGTVSGCGDSRSVTLTANVSGVSGGEIPSGTVTFKSGETALGSAALQNGSASFVWNGVTAGNFSITAEYNGSGNYNASSSSSGSLAVEKQAQSPLSITPPASLTYGGSAFDLAVVGGSGTGAATYSVTGTAVSVSADGKVTILSAGTAKITVTKAEDANYLPASCEITLTVNKAAPSITKLPHANPIPTGTKLSEAKLLDGAAAGVDGAPLSGVFSWEQPDFKPQNAADYDESVIFTPTDLNYAPVKVGVISIRAQSGSVTGDPFSDTDDTTGNEVKPVNQVSDAVTGTAITSIAYTPSPSFDTDMLVAGVINSDGTVEYLPKSVYKDGSVILNDKVSGKVAVFYRSIRFVDTAGKWCDEAATYMAARDVVNGVGNAQFAPDSNIKRADFVLMLVRAFAGDTAGNGTFSDVDQSAYYAKAVSVAKALGIATGADGLFSPDANITRQDMFVLFERTLEAFGLIDKNADTSLISFSDMDSAADYAKEDIILLAANGYINGTDGKINPNGTATRAEAAQMLMNFLKASAK